MKNKIELPELLKNVAHQLDEHWRYNAILSNVPTNHGQFLSNGAGLYIKVRTQYGQTLHQWSICYIDPKHNIIQSYETVGCSIEKNVSSIVADLKNRLLCKTGEAYKKLADITENYQEQANAAEHNKFVINALGKVLNISDCYDHRYTYSYRIENDDGCRLATIKRYGFKENFKMVIDEVTPDQIVKIMQIVNSEEHY